MLNRSFFTLAALLLLVLPAGKCIAENPILFDFDGPIAFAADPDGTEQYRVWIPVNNTYGTTLDLTTMEDSQALKYIDNDTTRENGVYTIVKDAIPEAGNYVLRCKFKVFDTLHAGSYGAYTQFDLACQVNGSHREQSGTLPSPTIVGTVGAPYLDPVRNDSNKAVHEIETTAFNAQTGDDLLIVLSSYVGDYRRSHSAGTGYVGSYVIIDDIQLVNTVPVTLSEWTLE